MFPMLVLPFVDRSINNHHQHLVHMRNASVNKNNKTVTIHLAKASTAVSPTSQVQHVEPSTTASKKKRKNKYFFPFEGMLYDPISFTNFIDLDRYKGTATLQKSLPINWLSSILDADLPMKFTLSGKLGTLGIGDGLKMNPIARLGFNLRLLDLGSATDSRQKGFLKFKASYRSDGRVDHGFEIDRKIDFANLQTTMLYGNVNYKTSNRNANDEWKTSSSFGIHQDLKLAGVKFAARLGYTPEGNFVYDLKL